MCALYIHTSVVGKFYEGRKKGDERGLERIKKSKKKKKSFGAFFGLLWKERDKLPGPNGYIQEDPDEGVFYHPL
jgi:hypothetical protein